MNYTKIAAGIVAGTAISFGFGSVANAQVSAVADGGGTASAGGASNAAAVVTYVQDTNILSIGGLNAPGIGVGLESGSIEDTDTAFAAAAAFGEETAAAAAQSVDYNFFLGDVTSAEAYALGTSSTDTYEVNIINEFDPETVVIEVYDPLSLDEPLFMQSPN